jgi:galactokinase
MNLYSNPLTRALEAAFIRHFNAAPTIIARAPGRVNLLGEHTDYNDGFVLPMAISRQTMVAARPNGTAMLNMVAADMGDARASIALDAPILTENDDGQSDHWVNYARGMAHLLRAAGVEIPGADVVIMGDMPQGAGLSSSAALEMALGLALCDLAGRGDIDRTLLAQIGQQCEHDFAGCACGIMDQLVSARGQSGHAVLIDCRSLLCQPITMPDDLMVMIVHSGVQRGLVEGHYNARRQQCFAASAHFGVPALRDVSLKDLAQDGDALDPVTLRRARHVVTENARVLAASEALAAGDGRSLGKLMHASHASMRDDFEITVPAIDQLVDIMQNAIGDAGGARMTGGGFGGAVVAILPRCLEAEVISTVRNRYRTPGGAIPDIMLESASAGASVLRSNAS